MTKETVALVEGFNGDCPICGADIGPSTVFVWHREDEDCRAVRDPVDENALWSYQWHQSVTKPA